MFPAFALAEPVTGVVTNMTTNKPSAGDDVVLLKLEQGMQEIGRTKTDTKGKFSIDVPAQGLHILRVMHDKASYFRPLQPGTQSVEIPVYTAAEKVAGVAQEADVMRIESDPSGSGLKVVEHYFLKNASTPPETQFSDRPFELWLPAGAVVEGSAAQAPGGMAVQSALVPLGEPNHFTMIFPLRPGETQFQVTYKLPYSGSIKLAPRPVLATDTVAIMLPKSIAFKADPAAAYQAVTEETTAQTYVARNVLPGQPLSFTLTGTGALPRDTVAQNSGQQGPEPASAGSDPQTPAQASAAMRNDTGAGKGLGNPLDSEGDLEPWAKYKWWILGGFAVVLAIGAGFLMRGPSTTLEEAASSMPDYLGISPPSTSILTTLKEELFTLETERLQGRITETEYTESKAAIEVVLKRALLRVGPPAGAPAEAAESPEETKATPQ